MQPSSKPEVTLGSINIHGDPTFSDSDKVWTDAHAVTAADGPLLTRVNGLNPLGQRVSALSGGSRAGVAVCMVTGLQKRKKGPAWR